MVFLNPAVLFGLIAAAIPVVLHFLNLQKLNRIEFSTLAFLKELQKTKIRKLKFKQWLLLLLRVLLILLIVAAFARPTLESFTISGTSAAKTSSVFVIDDSFSMSLIKGNGSQFNKAKEIVKNVIRDYQEGDETTVLFAADENVNSFSPNFQSIVESLNEKEISIKRESFASVLESAVNLLKASQNFNKELFILSDFSKNNFKNKLESLKEKLDENTKVYLFDFADNEYSNRAVTDFELSNQLLEVDKNISFTAKIKNTNGSSVSNGVVSLFIKGKRSAQQSFNLDQNETKTISFESVLKDKGLVDAYVEIEQDDILFDNIRYTAFFVPEKIKVLLVSSSQSDSRFVALALQSGSENTTIEINQINFAQLSSNLYKENDVVVIIGAPALQANSLNDYLTDGGKIIWMPSSSTTSQEFQSTLKNFGINSNVQLIGQPNSTQSISYFGNVEYEHPIFKNLFEDRKDTKVESPEIYSYFKIDLTPSLKPIISLRDNSLFLSEYEKGNGQMLIFSSAPLLSWNNFPIKSLFAPLINKSVLYQTMKTELGQNVIAGDEVDIRIDNLKLPQVRIVKPDKTEEFVNIEELDNRNFFNYNKTDELGVYEFYSGDELVDFASVNFDPNETNTESSTKDEIENYLSDAVPEENLIIIDPADNYKEEIKQARFGTELWKYFLIAALIVALIEMFVSKNSKKDFAEVKNKGK